MHLKRHIRTATSLLASLIILGGCASSISLSPEVINRAQVTQSHLNAPRFGHSVVQVGDSVYTIGGLNKNGLLTSIEVIDTQTLKSTIKQIDITPRVYGSAVWDGKDSIYVIGGLTNINQGAYRAHLDIINIKTLEVTTGPDMPIRCDRPSASRVGNDIYVSGGMCDTDNRNETGYSSVVQKYSLDSQTWSSVAPLPHRMETKTVTANGKLYAVGGYTGKSAVTTVVQYDPESDTWLELPPLPVKTSAHSLVAVGDSIIVLGDYEEMNRSLLYDTNKRVWNELTIPFKPVRHASASNKDNQVILVGGNTGSNGPFHNYIQSIQIK